MPSWDWHLPNPMQGVRGSSPLRSTKTPGKASNLHSLIRELECLVVVYWTLRRVAAVRSRTFSKYLEGTRHRPRTFAIWTALAPQSRDTGTTCRWLSLPRSLKFPCRRSTTCGARVVAPVGSVSARSLRFRAEPAQPHLGGRLGQPQRHRRLTDRETLQGGHRQEESRRPGEPPRSRHEARSGARHRDRRSDRPGQARPRVEATRRETAHTGAWRGRRSARRSAPSRSTTAAGNHPRT